MLIHDYMRRPAEQRFQTEEYVSTPPALWIHDERGDVWTLGSLTGDRRDAPNGEYDFPVLKNGDYAGLFASRIERRKGHVRAFTRQGWKVWSGTQFL